jgi:hypothetical protein
MVLQWTSSTAVLQSVPFCHASYKRHITTELQTCEVCSSVASGKAHGQHQHGAHIGVNSTNEESKAPNGAWQLLTRLTLVEHPAITA